MEIVLLMNFNNLFYEIYFIVNDPISPFLQER